MIAWIAAGLSLTGVVFNAKKSIWCWPIWILSNVCWLYYTTFVNRQLPQMILWSVFLAANIYGFFEWRKNKTVQHP